jgi:hypothetical protein
MGFSEEITTEVVQSLADLYIASRIPYKVRGRYPDYPVKNTKYWSYSETTEKILGQLNLVDSGSRYTVYSKSGDVWYFITLTEKGLNAAKEAYKERLNSNLKFVEELTEKYENLLPIVTLGYYYDDTIERAFLYSKESPSIGLSGEDLIEFKVNRIPEFHTKGDHSKVMKYWWEEKSIREGEKLDIVISMFGSIVRTKTIVSALNEFFNPLFEKRLVLLMPDFSTSNVYTDFERWIFTDELLDIIKEKTTIEKHEELKEVVKEYVSVFLLWLGRRGYTKGQILKAVEVIVNENKDLELSFDELLDRFYKVVDEVNSVTGCISKFNKLGSYESMPFIVLDENALDKTIGGFLENLGSRVLFLS